MNWWDSKAAKIQRAVRTDENEFDSRFSDDEARRAIVHTRQDVVLLVAHLSTANLFLSRIWRWLVVLTITTIIIAVRLWWR